MSFPIFTCNCCEIQFKSSDLQRYHMKTEWHRYNLKRRMAKLPCITAAQFAEKLQLSERQRQENEVDEFGFAVLKPKNNARQLLKEKKAKQKHSPLDDRGRRADIEKQEGSARSSSPTESLASEISRISGFSVDTNTDFGEDTVSEYGFTSESNYDSDNSTADDFSEMGNDRIDIFECIYCGVKHKEIERNVNHMFREHGLYIPERSYLTDLPGLLNYLIDQIVMQKRCFCCNFEGSTLESIRAHMHSKRHCRLPYETKHERERLSQFYDFSSLSEDSYESQQSSRNDKEIHFSDSEEDANSESGHTGQEINSNYTTVSVDTTGMELTLPTGARVGHRVGQRYYRQNLPMPSDVSDSRRTVTAADRRMVSGVTEKQYKKGLKKMQQLEKNAVNRQIRQEKTKRVNFQPHYRDELLQ
ncbi:hypothetical protein HG536_0E01630 [Torulaspora globosa]|uniref:C2H2-type domain-containing protein n=1 Tax=Torulaspora globosa TaxID=48254 RepID=A0A7G3ZIB6_9SACH|nr:uncharacterized protein HG536_0E01630 [Torulaspora globosa]QLL33252.1 hypothetical protein HG536_0E01630 [Torulaspora globosa]